jgi:ABC-type branched-subunit amino acid transport system ATPase component
VSDTILETSGLTREFQGFVAVNDVDLAIRVGTIHALIGPNGAGKTTCFNLLTKFLQPTRGTIRFKGRDITGLKPAEVARLGLIRSFQISAVFAHLTALENVRVALQRARGGSFDFWRSDAVLKIYDSQAHALLEDVGLGDDAQTLAGELSYGRKRALEIATTLALDPEMLLLDEPTAGMTHEDVERIVALIRRVRTGRTILMVEHNLSVVEGLCDSITVLARGQVLAQGNYAAVSENADVVAAYLGSSMDEPATAGSTTIGSTTIGREISAPAMLEIRGLNAWYGESHVLQGVDFDVREGEVVTLLGRNGAGKTTTMKTIMGLVAHRSGQVRFRGQDLIGLRPNQIARAGIALCPEERAIFAALNVTENLMLPRVVAPGGLDLETIYALFPNLRERAASQGTKLSGGEQQMLAIARILRTGARLLLLDEPTEGLAPVIVQQIGRTIRAIRARGFTVLLVEQNFRFAATVADRHYVMEHGRIVDMIPNAQLATSMDKLHDYLGV